MKKKRGKTTTLYYIAVACHSLFLHIRVNEMFACWYISFKKLKQEFDVETIFVAWCECTHGMQRSCVCACLSVSVYVGVCVYASVEPATPLARKQLEFIHHFLLYTLYTYIIVRVWKYYFYYTTICLSSNVLREPTHFSQWKFFGNRAKYTPINCTTI